MNFIQIDGWAGAGKAILWSLLDGHSELFVNPIHDFTHCASFAAPTRLTFRKLLTTTEYYKLEKLSRLGFDPIDFGNGESRDNPFNFDFYLFDRLISEFFYSDRADDGNNFLLAYMNAFLRSYKTKIYDADKIKHFVSMGNYYEVENSITSGFIEKNKTIFVRRDAEGIIAARTNRSKRDIDEPGSKQFAPSFRDLMRVSEVESIQAYNSLILKLRLKFPDNVLVVNFEDLIFAPRETMLDVASFIGIDFEEILCSTTRDGRLIGDNGVGFIGKVNDDPRIILTKREKMVIKAHKILFHVHRNAVNILRLNAIIVWAYQKLKRKGIFGGL